ncbi:MAG: hypothetical protein K6L73_06860 [Cellvibrionaceae bacterium]
MDNMKNTSHGESPPDNLDSGVEKLDVSSDASNDDKSSAKTPPDERLEARRRVEDKLEELRLMREDKEMDYDFDFDDD